MKPFLEHTCDVPEQDYMWKIFYDSHIWKLEVYFKDCLFACETWSANYEPRCGMDVSDRAEMIERLDKVIDKHLEELK